ncbi:transcriptional regulator [Streptomyces sp. 900116325]
MTLLQSKTVSDWFRLGRAADDFEQLWSLITVLVHWTRSVPGPPFPAERARRSFWADLWEQARATTTPGSGRETTTLSQPTRLGRPIADWDPLDLEVHPAVLMPAGGLVAEGGGNGSGARGTSNALPAYVRRAHDDALAALVEAAIGGRSQMAVLVGGSSTGKTRACWEAVQPLAQRGWTLWHPFEPTRADAAAADLKHVGPRTVVWLNEAQHYLDPDGGGEPIGAALHGLLTDTGRGPVLILGTLWPEYASAYCALPDRRATGGDPYARVRELLAGRRIALPDRFDPAARTAAEVLATAGDENLALALEHTSDGRVTQFLAGAPELMHRYEAGTLPARALLHAAMDAARLGAGVHLPRQFLEHATTGYLTDDEYDALDNDWLKQAFAETGNPVHGDLAPLRRVRARAAHPAPGGVPSATVPAVPSYRLADYLDQHGRHRRRTACPPASFWEAAHDHLAQPDPDVLLPLARAAESRHRLFWAQRLRVRAADSGSMAALRLFADRREQAGDAAGAEDILSRIARAGDVGALVRLAALREQAGDGEAADAYYQQAARAGDTMTALIRAEERRRSGDREGAERLYRRLAETGDEQALAHLVDAHMEAGDHAGAETLLREAAAGGSTAALIRLGRLRWEQAGDSEAAEALYRQAELAGDFDAWVPQVELLESRGEHEESESLARLGEEIDSPEALLRLVELRFAAGDVEGAERLATGSAAAGVWSRLAGLLLAEGDVAGAESRALRADDAKMLAELSVQWEEDGDHDRAASLAVQAAERGHSQRLHELALRRDTQGEPAQAVQLAVQAARCGRPRVLFQLALRRQTAGDQHEADRLFELAAANGDTDALIKLAALMMQRGDTEEAERFALRAAGKGNTRALYQLALNAEKSGKQQEADRLARLVGGTGDTYGLVGLAVLREKAGNRVGAEPLYREAAAAGSQRAHKRLAQLLERAGESSAAEALAAQAADHGAFAEIAVYRARHDDRAGAELLALQAVDAGDTQVLYALRRLYEEDGSGGLDGLWRYGLDPDGTPSAPW